VAWSGFLAVFLIGLLGGVHCLGMCGGIVGALSLQTAQGAKWPLHLAYNLGRITTYTLLGALLGWLGAIGGMLEGVLPVQLTLYVACQPHAGGHGLYFLGQTRWLAPFERAGHRLWQRIQPLTRRFLPVRSVAQAFPLGLLWGFLPCGLVYSVLATALLAGDGVRGAG